MQCLHTYVRFFIESQYIGMRMATSPPASMPCASGARPLPPCTRPLLAQIPYTTHSALVQYANSASPPTSLASDLLGDEEFDDNVTAVSGAAIRCRLL